MNSVRTIAVIPQGSTHRYWKAIRAGVNKAAQDLATNRAAVNIAWKGPLREGNHEEQIQIVRGFIKSGVQGIVLAPFNSSALVAPVEEAAGSGIPTVVIDAALDSPQIVSLISTDNIKAGAIGADRMAGILSGRGKVLLLRYLRGSASTQHREQGFVERLNQAHHGIELILSDEYAGPTRDTARQASENLLAHLADQVHGVFTTNESSTAGMLMALQHVHKAGRLVFVGFDSSDVYQDAMRYNQLHGLVVQDPFRMGELGVKTVIDHLDGKPVPKRVDTGATMVTPENMDTPAAKALLNPPLAKYL